MKNKSDKKYVSYILLPYYPFIPSSLYNRINTAKAILKSFENIYQGFLEVYNRFKDISY